MPTYLNNREETIFALDEYFASQNSDDQTNLGARGGVITINVPTAPVTNEIQELAVDATAGTFTITWSGQTTAAIDSDATAAEVTAALEALSNIGAGNIEVTDGPGDLGATTPYVIEFIGDLANANRAEITASSTGLLTPGGTATPATTVGGVEPVNEVQALAVDATGGTFTVTWSGQTTSALDFDFTGAEMTTAMEALSNIGAGNIVVTGGPGDNGGTTPYSFEFTGTLAGGNRAEITANGASLTGGAGTATPSTTTAGVAAVNEQQTVTVAADGGTFTITYSGQTTSALAYDSTAAEIETALEALSNIGVGDATVTGDAGGPWTIEFTGALAATNVDEVTCTATGLLTNTGATATPSTAQAGGVSDSPSVVFTVKGKDSLGGVYSTLLASAAVTGAGVTTLRVYPGSTVTANVSANASLPAVWRLEAVAANDDGLSYSASVNYLL